MKKLIALLFVFGMFTVSAKADNLTAQILPGIYVSVPGSNLSVDTLMNINGRAGSPAPQFMAGLSSRVASYKQFGLQMGAITNTGYDYRAYYSIAYDYKNANPGLFMIISQITVSAFYSTLFDGRPNLYGMTISKKLF